MGDEGVGREVPVIPLGAAGIVRCRRCRTYMNPFCQWADGGRRFKCNVCTMLNEAPVEYFSTLDGSGRRRDAEERPELSQGTVEWVAPTEYMVGLIGGPGSGRVGVWADGRPAAVVSALSCSQFDQRQQQQQSQQPP
jgi:hypothetical protein